MHPLIEEICRARDVQPHALGRWQHELRTTIQPMLDELDAIKRQPTCVIDDEVVTIPLKRGPGRPRKDEVR